MKGIKAFNKDMKCQGFHFEEGKVYTHNGEVQCCPSQSALNKGKGGFHFCTNPFDCLNYYSLTDSEFHEVESLPDAKIQKNEDDSKVSTAKIKIGVKLGIKGFVEAAVSFLLQSCKNKEAQSGNYSKSAQSGNSSKSAQSGYFSKSAQSGNSSKSAQSGDYSKSAQSGYASKSAQSGDSSKSAQSGDYSQSAQSGDSSKSAQSGDYSKSAQSGDYSKSAQSGDSSKSAQSGDYSRSAQSGDYSQLELAGKYSIGANIGVDGKAKGKIGNWITLAEWKYDQDKDKNVPVCVKSTQIDGKKLKEDVWYTLQKGEFVRTENI